MNILNLSKRYFWSHLLLGVVAAGLGLSSNLVVVTSQNTFPAAIFASIKASYAAPRLHRQAALKINQAVFRYTLVQRYCFSLSFCYDSISILFRFVRLWIATTLGIRAGPAY